MDKNKRPIVTIKEIAGLEGKRIKIESVTCDCQSEAVYEKQSDGTWKCNKCGHIIRIKDN